MVDLHQTRGMFALLGAASLFVASGGQGWAADYYLYYPTPTNIYASITIVGPIMQIRYLNRETAQFQRNPADDLPGYDGYSSGQIRLRFPTSGRGTFLQFQGKIWSAQGTVGPINVVVPPIGGGGGGGGGGLPGGGGGGFPGGGGGGGFPGGGVRRTYTDLANGQSPWWEVRPAFPAGLGFAATEIAFVGTEANGQAHLAAGETPGPHYRCIYQGGFRGDRVLLADLQTGQVLATFQVNWQNNNLITWASSGRIYTLRRMHPNRPD